jgi:hypothetical protein
MCKKSEYDLRFLTHFSSGHTERSCMKHNIQTLFTVMLSLCSTITSSSHLPRQLFEMREHQSRPQLKTGSYLQIVPADWCACHCQAVVRYQELEPRHTQPVGVTVDTKITSIHFFTKIDLMKQPHKYAALVFLQNQLLLLFGRRKGTRCPQESPPKHPALEGKKERRIPKKEKLQVTTL